MQFWIGLLLKFAHFMIGSEGSKKLRIIGTNSNSIRILWFIRNTPDFCVKKFQLFVGNVSISVVIMIVYVIFVKVVLQKIVLVFMRPQKVPIVKFCLIEFLFQIKNLIVNSFNMFFAYWHISRLWRSWYINAKFFNKVLGYFCLSRPSGDVDAVKISSSAEESDDVHFWAYIYLSLSVVSCSRILNNSSCVEIRPWSSLFLFSSVGEWCYL